MKASIIGFALLLIFSGCAPSARITSDYDDNIDFTTYRTFDWMTPPGEIEDPLGGYPTVALRIKNAIENNLEEKGFAKVESGPDFYVVYHASIKHKLSRAYIDTWGYYYPRYRRYPPGRRGYPPTAWGFVYVDAYDEGTLVIDIVDAQTNELAWRGTATGTVGDPRRAREKINEAVHLILESFPPYGHEENHESPRISDATH